MNVEIKPTPEGLHVIRCNEYFGDGKNGCVFGQNIPDNNTNFGASMGMCNNNIGKLNNSNGIDTIKESKKRFLERDQKKAKLVRRHQHVGGHHSDATLIYSSVTNGIKNSPITKQDIEMALDMLGRSDAAVQGKTTRSQPDVVDDAVVIDCSTYCVRVLWEG